MAGDPIWVRMRSGYWTSPDAVHWRRVSTLAETSGKADQLGHNYSVWTPIPVFNAEEDRWNLFHVIYDSNEVGNNVNGRIMRAASTIQGHVGLAGPYKDVGIVMETDGDAEPWEGQQGVDSFVPYQANGRWYSFYGSHSYIPFGPWQAGLATAPRLAGPWKRVVGSGPSPTDVAHNENARVTRVGDWYVMLYDWTANATPMAERKQLGYNPDGRYVGYSCSRDGIHWTKGRPLMVQPEGKANWARYIVTPLSLIEEKDGTFTMLFTGNITRPDGTGGYCDSFEAMGAVRLRLTKGEK